MSRYSKRVPNHHRTGLIGDDYPIDPYKRGEMTDDPYNRYWTEESMTLSARKSNPFVTNSPERKEHTSYRGYSLHKGASLHKAHIGSRVVIEREDLSSSDFSEADLVDVIFYKCVLNSVNFTGANLEGALFSECTIRNCRFDRARGENISFKNCSQVVASFTRAGLERATFQETNLYNSSFSGTNLIGASFTDLSIKDCVFESAVMDESVFSSVSFTSSGQLRGAKFRYIHGCRVGGDPETIHRFIESGEAALDTMRKDALKRL